MAKRPRPTLFDYALIAINPALIMLMVGSLAFFLVAVVYRGEFETRLCFILSMFVMAIVLITRISIERGAEYASLFAIPLALVVLLALSRFVAFGGVLAPFSLLINLSLMALIWWSSHRITIDCTVIDESEEAPGEGLLQTAGFGAGNRDAATGMADRDGVSMTAGEQEKLGDAEESRSTAGTALSNYWQRARQPRAHGLWVVYFAAGSLPVFGFLQGFVDSLAGRRYVLLLFCVFMLSALGLLMTTSLLGLRRYLRQRYLEMPAQMPAVWFGFGGVLILAVILLCLLLPRPAPEYSISHLDWFASSPVTLQTNPWGPFEGKETPDASGGAGTSDSPDTTPENAGGSTPARDSSHAGSEDSGASRSSQDSSSQAVPSGGDGRQGDAGQTTSSPSNSQQGTSDSPGGQTSSSGRSGASQESPQQRRGQPSGTERTDGTGQGDMSARQQETTTRAQDSPTRAQDSPSSASEPTETASPEAPSSATGAEQEGTDAPRSGSASSRQARPAPNEAGQTGASERMGADEPEGGQSARHAASSAAGSAQDESGGNRQSAPASSSVRAPSTSLTIGSVAGGLLKLIYYAAVLVILVFLLWRFRDQLRDAWSRLMAELRDLFARWGGSDTKERAEEEAELVAPERPIPFSAFTNPFRLGTTAKRPVAELLRYSFAALEAWGREQGVARRQDETPLEFAQRLGARFPEMSRNVRDVCLLYSQLAYGRGEIPRETTRHLQRIWTLLDEHRPLRDHSPPAGALLESP